MNPEMIKDIKEAKAKLSRPLQVLIIVFLVPTLIGTSLIHEGVRDIHGIGDIVAIIIGGGLFFLLLLLLLSDIVKKCVLTVSLVNPSHTERVCAGLGFVLTLIFLLASFAWKNVPNGPIHFVETGLLIFYFYIAVSSNVFAIIAGLGGSLFLGPLLFVVIALAYLLLLLEQNVSILSRLFIRGTRKQPKS